MAFKIHFAWFSYVTKPREIRLKNLI